LHYLSNHDAATLVELSVFQGVEKPTVTRNIRRLEDLEYVEHVPSKDRREKRIQLTPLGNEVYKKVRITIDQYEQEILNGITEEEQIEVIRIMEKVRNNIND